MQRTYSVKGNSCIRNVVVESASIMKMDHYAVGVSIFILVCQLVACCLALAAFIPWLLSAIPIGPGVRIVKEDIYFLTLVNSAGIIQGMNELCNAPAHTIWQTLDVVVRIGESLATRSEVVGHITMDKPKLIRSLTNGKQYY